MIDVVTGFEKDVDLRLDYFMPKSAFQGGEHPGKILSSLFHTIETDTFLAPNGKEYLTTNPRNFRVVLEAYEGFEEDDKFGMQIFFTVDLAGEDNSNPKV